MQTVSYTSQWTAAARALESERADAPLFEDRFARELAAPKGFELLEKYRGGGLVEFVAIRTKFLDDTVENLLSGSEIRQVVLIAAGMDMRAFRLRWPADAVVYEVDHDALLAEKRRRLSTMDAQPFVRRQEVPADLAEDWVPRLTAAGFDPGKPTLWIAEALLFFLTEDQASTLLRAMASVSAPGSQLALDILSEQLLRSPATRFFLSALAKDGIPWLFGTDEPEEFLRPTGWDLRVLTEPGRPDAGEGRWPYEVQPREVPGVSRNWLIRAEIATG
ncbi:SAM-dependent methyltransferase [Solihabitans fulvus]|uniref:S-adenosyl-L-methionine-dependent methyltransferase n=1 Tax=Solihabitans fulvus TaxID=1892852 RepID=A0A5B2WWU9_9PSEU|nr:SAM-dependent methyltransferase [Solihabitans fulvus]KAA2255350.1 SAM-dependent methyltransferase [Solihabitans fulvus]